MALAPTCAGILGVGATGAGAVGKFPCPMGRGFEAAPSVTNCLQCRLSLRHNWRTGPSRDLWRLKWGIYPAHKLYWINSKGHQKTPRFEFQEDWQGPKESNIGPPWFDGRKINPILGKSQSRPMWTMQRLDQNLEWSSQWPVCQATRTNLRNRKPWRDERLYTNFRHAHTFSYWLTISGGCEVVDKSDDIQRFARTNAFRGSLNLINLCNQRQRMLLLPVFVTRMQEDGTLVRIKEFDYVNPL